MYCWAGKLGGVVGIGVGELRGEGEEGGRGVVVVAAVGWLLLVVGEEEEDGRWAGIVQDGRGWSTGSRLAVSAMVLVVLSVGLDD